MSGRAGCQQHLCGCQRACGPEPACFTCCSSFLLSLLQSSVSLQKDRHGGGEARAITSHDAALPGVGSTSAISAAASLILLNEVKYQGCDRRFCELHVRARG